VFLVVSVGAVQ